MFVTFHFTSANTFNLDKAKILSVDWLIEWCLTHYQTTNFRLFRTESVCRRQFQIWRKWQKTIQTGRKHCGEKEKLLVTSNFSFSQSVFKRLVSKGRQKVSLYGNDLTPLSTVFQLYRGGKFTYPCFPGVLLTSAPHKIPSKLSAAFPHNHCRNYEQRRMNPVAMTFINPRKEFWQSQGSNKWPPAVFN